MNELYATLTFLFVLFALLGGSVWVGLALMGVISGGFQLGSEKSAGMFFGLAQLIDADHHLFS